MGEEPRSTAQRRKQDVSQQVLLLHRKKLLLKPVKGKSTDGMSWDPDCKLVTFYSHLFATKVRSLLSTEYGNACNQPVRGLNLHGVMKGKGFVVFFRCRHLHSSKNRKKAPFITPKWECASSLLCPVRSSMRLSGINKKQVPAQPGTFIIDRPETFFSLAV